MQKKVQRHERPAIDKMVIRNFKRRQTGLRVAWVDYKKAYDTIPHSWIIKCLQMFGAATNMIALLEKSMAHWRTELIVGGQTLGIVNIRRGIFQGDSLSPLLFVVSLITLSMVFRQMKVGYELGNRKGLINHLLFMDDLKLYGKNEKQADTLVNTFRIFSKDIGMEFGIRKCAVLIVKRGKAGACEGVVLPDAQFIRGLEEGDRYKYLGVLEADDVKHNDMKQSISKEYLRRIRKILKSKLNGGNNVSAINSRAVSLVRYGEGIIRWSKDELRALNKQGIC